MPLVATRPGETYAGAPAAGVTLGRGLGVRRSTTGEGLLELPAAGAAVHGVVIADHAVQFTVQRTGIVEAVAGAVLAIGPVEVDADGKFVPHAAGEVAGWAERATTAADQRFPLHLGLEA